LTSPISRSFSRLTQAAPDPDYGPRCEQKKEGQRIPKAAGNNPFADGSGGQHTGQRYPAASRSSMRPSAATALVYSSFCSGNPELLAPQPIILSVDAVLTI